MPQRIMLLSHHLAEDSLVPLQGMAHHQAVLVPPAPADQDLVYDEAYEGRAAIAAFLQKVERLVPQDIRFCVEDITDGDPRRCGVRW
jgi:hypothetical protein